MQVPRQHEFPRHQEMKAPLASFGDATSSIQHVVKIPVKEVPVARHQETNAPVASFGDAMSLIQHVVKFPAKEVPVARHHETDAPARALATPRHQSSTCSKLTHEGCSTCHGDPLYHIISSS